MPRIMAIDYGAKRVGLAVTDPLKLIASPLDTIHSKDLVPYIRQYLEKEAVEAFVVGMPKTLQNTDTNATQMAKGCVTILRKNFPQISIHLQDERFTSVMAMNAMIAGGVKKKDRRNKANIDKLSATIILQSYLERSSYL
jgi:putative Holliday junction resolvase